MQVAEIDNCSRIKPSVAFAAHFAGGLVEHLRAQCEVFCYVPLHLPTEEPIILVVRPGINPVATTPAYLPWSPAFLNPNRKKCLDLSTSQALVFITGGKHNNWKDSNLWTGAGLLDESELGTYLHVGVSVV